MPENRLCKGVALDSPLFGRPRRVRKRTARGDATDDIACNVGGEEERGKQVRVLRAAAAARAHEFAVRRRQRRALHGNWHMRYGGNKACEDGGRQHETVLRRNCRLVR